MDSAAEVEALRERWVAWRSSELRCDEVSNKADALRKVLVERWGEPAGRISADELWGHDGDCRQLTVLNEESDRLSDAATDLLDELIAAPAENAADVCLKLYAVAWEWRPLRFDDGTEYHETMTAAFLREASALLSPSMEV